ncbi:prephenate dehydrogenase [Corynebacterium ciconiae DSM 44920]|uniref:prephenate dehydrogenase n=1 Tax=Corynebacterium ciconiae TaxID=227319 RepID=UPI00038246BD|nr:prephenate dehydrogenase [Corynebacterium ciconiae]WKD60180.1 prephenate dehydrogenase [Corynebacterium ciconiae DSM 44920]
MIPHNISRPVCILGLGLIGGSLLRDLHRAGHACFGFNRSPSAVSTAQDEGYNVSSELEPTLERAEREGALIVLAVPMPAIGTMLDAIATYAPSCGITDVVSVKSAVLAEVTSRGMASRYVGGHPMAGTADSGWSAAHHELFKGAAWVITFDYAADNPEAVDDTWLELWVDCVRMASKVGAEVIPARSDHHDSAVARISHVPHLLAEALAVVGDNGGPLALSLAAGSFRDGTRVAGSAPSLVRAMCETNHEAVLTALDEALNLLNDARTHLTTSAPNIGELVDFGYRSRVRFEARSNSTPTSGTQISSRPVLRIQPGSASWVQQLVHAEGLGARIELLEAPAPLSNEEQL